MKSALLAAIVLVLGLTGVGGDALAQISPEELQRLFDEKRTALVAPVATLQDRYEVQLKTLAAEAQTQGDLQQVVEVQAEIQACRDPNHRNPAAYETYPRLGEAHAIYQRALWELRDTSRPREIELHQTYFRSLGALRETLTRSGQIDDALALETRSAPGLAALYKLQAMQRWKGKGNFERTVLWELRTPADLVENGTITLEEREGRYHLSSPERDMTRFESRFSFRPPMRLIARAATDSTSVRLYYGAGTLAIFNWESRPDELRIHDPTTGFSHSGYPDKGTIETKRFYDFEARITDNRISIYVDGVLRTSRQGDFASANGPFGIGPAFGGVVSVEAMAVFGEK
jgi:hypothetical protein